MSGTKQMTYTGQVNLALRRGIERALHFAYPGAWVDIADEDVAHGEIQLDVPDKYIPMFVELGFVVTGENDG